MNQSDLIKREILTDKIPRFLFKYRAIDSILDKIIKNSMLWFANPLSFNDPFDCQIQIDTQNTKDEIKKYITSTLTNVNKSEIEKYVDFITANPSYWPETVKKAIDKSINSQGICCFTTDDKNILMWSHYTDCHKGVSLKFDLMKDLDFFAHPIKVAYTEKYPIYNHIRDNKKLVDLLIASKSDIWRYEDEFRVLKANSGLHSFNKKALVEVTFGTNCKREDSERVRKLFLQNNYNHTIFKQASVSKNRYEIQVTDF